ncbi:NADAR family protein [Tessaracoccus flavescens]|uniref:NADAR domain-containing protein n=1 Tax=Tessaracoccus flavescens TaxID=399497 RepID=A0A1Q2CZD5_9ACTN|nr:NADAR family protein [Tessaracoccus flavescens]AQP51473.1 hypothetical protein BW733_12275 [Tessaracoccus flavescens]
MTTPRERVLLDQAIAGAVDGLDPLLFWGHAESHGRVTQACLSQWYPARFTVDGVHYTTAEQYMMAGKARRFRDDEVLARILASDSPRQIKQLGRQVRGFVARDWEETRFAIVVEGNVAKFGQNPDLRDFLLDTGDRLIVEASPVDEVWGIGLRATHARARDPRQWRGLNLLGFALMEARSILRAGDDD